ncbi:MAG: aminoglycoside phosphotransferase family protein [Cyanobacteria bacterium P01_A01_bin.83]
MEFNKASNSIGIPTSEIEIDTALVLNLLQQQHPDLMHLPIKLFDAGWDNAIFRLGDKLLVRLPRHQAAAKLIEHEQIWLPLLAPRLTIPVPIPYRIGEPTSNYPWKWSILPWLNGITAAQEPPNPNQAKIWASFLRLLHHTAPSNAPKNLFRGVRLKQRAADIEQRIQRLEQNNLITTATKNLWAEALDTPIDTEAKWLHGDLHPGNVLVEKGALAGIIDWGDLTSGDIATDLASIWMLFPQQHARQQAITEYAHVSAQTLQRAKGWVIYFGITLLDTGLIDNATQAAIGARTLNCVAEDE